MPSCPARTSRFSRLGAALIALSVVMLALGASGGITSVGADSSGPGAVSAANWLATELSANGNQLSNAGTIDWGLTADAALAITAVEGRGNSVAVATIDNLVAHFASYSSWDDLGPYPGVRLAGPTAKTLFIALAEGRPAADGSVSVETELRSLLIASGDQAGRYADRNAYSGDSSNGFSQALAILALARTATPAPSSAASFLVAQQCPAGGFRLTYFGGATCTDDASADSDATALAVQALATVDQTTEVTDATARAIVWCLSIQNPTTGAFGGTGPTSAPNANSTGLIGQALRAGGQSAAADRAAAWVSSLQRIAPAADAGAIGYDSAAFAAGIGTTNRDQWRRSTAQALFALGVAPLSTIATSVTPTSTTPTSTTQAGATSSTTSPTSTATTSTTAIPRSTTTIGQRETTTTLVVTVSTAPTLATTIEVAPVAVEAASNTRSAAALAVTGADESGTTLVGLVLLVVGMAMLGWGHRRSSRTP